MEKIRIGGQAVIEGVLMRSPNYYTVCVRQPDQQIVCKTEFAGILVKKYPWLKKAFVRGIVILVESLVIGIKALNYSALVAFPEEEANKKNSTLLLSSTIIFSFALGIGLFVILPYYLTSRIAPYGFLFNFIDGIMRLVIFLVYIYIITNLKDIQRVFQYHGAEHKVVYAYEKGEELTIENAQKYSTLHPRCGTAFLLVVMIVAILIFSLLPGFGTWSRWYKISFRLISRIIILPVIAALSYEFIRLAEKKSDRSHLAKWLIAPGLWLQKLTTKEPEPSQIEVAIIALKNVLEKEKTKEIK